MNPLRLLIVEDAEDDAALVVRELGRAGYDVSHVRVDDEASMRAALRSRTFDVVVSDHAMPRFSAAAALRVLTEHGIDLPFLIVSGSIPEDLAVSAMRAGAHDFVTKHQLARLVPAVQRELRDAAVRSERRTAERRLLESEARYRRFFEDDLTGDALFDADGRIVDCNPAFVRIFGFTSRTAALDGSMAALFARPDEHARLLDRVRRERLVESFEAELRRTDGAPVIVVGNVVGDFRDDGELVGLRAYFFDVTARRELEVQFRHAQKMEAVGRLAGGIAHDFNNLLCAIGGYADLSLALAGSETLRAYVTEIKKAGERATLLTRRLLAFSRKQVVQPTVLDVNALILDLEAMLRRLIREDLQLTTLLDPAAGSVVADAGHLEQVVMNLVVNARDAIPRGGHIRLSTLALPADRTPPDADVPAGEWVVLTVADDGVGMTPEVREHVFEPFFTTKPQGEGTGLGLATVYGIVSQANGHVRLSTAPGEGATFRIYWPAAPARKTSMPAPAAPGPAAPGHETVLVAEDNAIVRGALLELLRRSGYGVLEAADGEEAIARAAGHVGPLHALVSDVVMPGLHGPDVAARIRRTRPDIRVLFLSAYAEELASGGQPPVPGAAFVAKPFRADELLRRLRELLRPQPAR
jgi:two-component system cell cycle sensor histidine kinase/response regulator CckA